MKPQDWKDLFAEWEADYAARRAEDAKGATRLPSPADDAGQTSAGLPPGRPWLGDIARDKGPAAPSDSGRTRDRENGR